MVIPVVGERLRQASIQKNEKKIFIDFVCIQKIGNKPPVAAQFILTYSSKIYKNLAVEFRRINEVHFIDFFISHRSAQINADFCLLQRNCSSRRKGFPLSFHSSNLKQLTKLRIPLTRNLKPKTP